MKSQTVTILNRFSKALCITLMASQVFADTATPVGSGQWNSWALPSSIRSSGFWDGPSTDGTGCNVGHWLTGTNNPLCVNVFGGGFSGTKPGALTFLSAAGSAQTPVPFMLSPSGGSRIITMRLEVAGMAQGNVFGYYLLANPAALFPLFSGANSAGAVALFNPAGPYGFYIESNGVVYRSHTSVNFAVFSEVPTLPTIGSNLSRFWIGVEDLPLPAGPLPAGFLGLNTDGDYNDMLFSMEIPPSDPPPAGGCTLTQGGYKNRFNSKLLAAGSMMIGANMYEAAQVNQMIQLNAVQGNGLTSLVHQLITAKLNWFYGATPPQLVSDAITAADALIGTKVPAPIGAGYLTPSSTSALTVILDNYNNGRLGPQHCR
jgi:hypothetical protein